LAVGAATALGVGAAQVSSVQAQLSKERERAHGEDLQEEGGGRAEDHGHEWEEVWEEERGTFLRPYISSVRVTACEATQDARVKWDELKKRTGLDNKWALAKNQARRSHSYLTGNQLGPEIAFAATTGLFTLIATKKILKLPFRLALLSGGLATAGLLPPYQQTVTYMTHRYDSFDWPKMKDNLDPKVIVMKAKKHLPFGLGKEENSKSKEEDHFDGHKHEDSHQGHSHQGRHHHAQEHGTEHDLKNESHDDESFHKHD